jgi:uncharacterized membrane protein YdfJ with MMPL/SSD domain
MDMPNLPTGMYGGKKMMLTKMFDESEAFNKLDQPTRTILYVLGNTFQQSTEYLFMSPEELQKNTESGTVDQWTKLLQLQETQNFIKGTMAFLSQISQRKTFQSLVSMAMSGNAQAAKQVQELSGIMNQVDTNKIIVLHRIPRPTEEVSQ